jgi:colanic acid/amylovoran biosynthesis glycosyltransferase
MFTGRPWNWAMANSYKLVTKDSPLVCSLCGTYLKQEMQSIYRQIKGLRDHRNIVFAEQLSNLEMFPFEPVVVMQKRSRPRLRGNFLLRFWYKHIVKKWPPPRPIGSVGRENEYYHPYDLVDLLRENKPDLVHCYYGHKAVKYLKMLKDAGVPFVISFHGVDVVKFIHREGYREELRAAFKEARLVMARSVSLLERLKQLGCPADKLRINRTPIPLSNITYKKRVAPEDGKWRMVQACRLIAKKGIFTILEALVLLIDRWPGLEYSLAGVGPDREEIERAVERHGLQEHVNMLGWLSQDELQDVYSKSHIFLHPSEMTSENDQEGVPNSMLEAMAAGLPVVATYHGGIPEAVTSGDDGLLVPERSPEELAEALAEMMSSRVRLEDFSAKAAESVRERFEFEGQIRNLEDIYREAMGLERIGVDMTPAIGGG